MALVRLVFPPVGRHPDDAVEDPRLADLPEVCAHADHLVLHSEPLRHLAPELLHLDPVANRDEVVPVDHRAHACDLVVVETRIIQ